MLTLGDVASRCWPLTLPRRAKISELSTRAGLIKNGVLIGAPVVVAAGAVRDSVRLEEGENLGWDRRLGRRLGDGFKGQVGAFKAQMGGAIQTEFKEDFVFRTNA